MRVGVAYVDVRVNMTGYTAQLKVLEDKTRAAVNRMELTFSKLGTSSGVLSSTMASTTRSADRLTTSVNRQKKSLLTLLPHVAQVTAAYMAMRAAWRGITAGVTVGAKFEQEMAYVRAISGRLAPEFKDLSQQFVAMSNAAKKAGKDTVWTATQAANALRYLSMAGFNATESIKSLSGVLDLALIGNLDLGRATDIVTDTLKAMGLEVDQLGRVVDVFTATITRTNTDIEMMGQAMKFAAPVAGVLGYSIEKLAAIIGILSQSGIKAGIAGRGIQQMMLRNISAAKKFGATMGSNVIEVLEKVNERQKEYEQTLGPLGAKQKILTELTKAYGRIALKGVLVIKDNIAAFKELEEAEKHAAGESEKAKKIIERTVISHVKLIASAMSSISIKVWENHTKGMKMALAGVRDWINDNSKAIMKFADASIALIKALTELGAVFLTYKTLTWLKALFLGITTAVGELDLSVAALTVTLSENWVFLALFAAYEGWKWISKAISDTNKLNKSIDDQTAALKRSKDATEDIATSMSKVKDFSFLSPAQANPHEASFSFLDATVKLTAEERKRQSDLKRDFDRLQELSRKWDDLLATNDVAAKTMDIINKKTEIESKYEWLKTFADEGEEIFKKVTAAELAAYKKSLTAHEDKLKKINKQLAEYALKDIATEKGKFEKMRAQVAEFESWALDEAEGNETLTNKIRESAAREYERILTEETKYKEKEANKQFLLDERLTKKILRNKHELLGYYQEYYELGLGYETKLNQKYIDIQEDIFKAEEKRMVQVGMDEDDAYALRVEKMRLFMDKVIGLTENMADSQSKIIDDSVSSSLSKASEVAKGIGRYTGLPVGPGSGGTYDVIHGRVFINDRSGAQSYAAQLKQEADDQAKAVADAAQAQADAQNKLAEEYQRQLESQQSSYSSLHDSFESFITERERRSWGLTEYSSEFDKLVSAFDASTSFEEATGILSDVLDTLKSIDSLTKQQVDYNSQQKSINDWIWDMTSGDLSPVQTSSSYFDKYAELFSAVDMTSGSGLTEFLTFAKDFLGYIKDFSPTAYAGIFSSVSSDVQSLGTASEILEKIADLGFDVSTDNIDNLVTALGDLDTGAGVAYSGTDELGKILSLTQTPFQDVVDALGTMTDTTQTKIVAVGQMFETLADQIGISSGDITTGIGAIYDQASANPTISYNPTTVDVPWTLWTGFGGARTWQALYNNIVLSSVDVPNGANSSLYKPSEPYQYVLWGPTGALGGLMNEPTIGGEKGPEWFVPTAEPYKSKFLDDVGASPKLIAEAISEQLENRDINVHISIDGREIGNVVARQTKDNTQLVSALRSIR